MINIIQDEAYHAHQNIVKLRNRVEDDCVELGRLLYEFNANKFYKQYGHPSFNSYLADPDVSIKRSVAYALKGNYEYFLLPLESPSDGLEETDEEREKREAQKEKMKKHLVEMGYNKAEIIRPFVKKKGEDIEAWINDAVALSRSDLRIKVNEANGKVKEWDDDAEFMVVVTAMKEYAWNSTNQERQEKMLDAVRIVRE